MSGRKRRRFQMIVLLVILSYTIYVLRVASEVWEPRRVFGSVVRMAVGPRAAAGDSWLCRAGVCDVARCIHLMTGPGLGSVRAGVSTYYMCAPVTAHAVTRVLCPRHTTGGAARARAAPPPRGDALPRPRHRPTRHALCTFTSTGGAGGARSAVPHSADIDL